MGFWRSVAGYEKCKLTKEEFQFLEEYVSDMSGGVGGGEEINYKKDFILTEEMEKMISNLQEIFSDLTEAWAYEMKGIEFEYSDVEEMRYVIDDVGNFIFEEDGEYSIIICVSCDLYNEDEDEDEDEDEEFEI